MDKTTYRSINVAARTARPVQSPVEGHDKRLLEISHQSELKCISLQE